MVWSAEGSETTDSNDTQRTQKRGGPSNSNGPIGPPPPGYECKRCGKPGHWIKLCPTNGDPNFDRDRDGRAQGGADSATGTVGKVKLSYIFFS